MMQARRVAVLTSSTKLFNEFKKVISQVTPEMIQASDPDDLPPSVRLVFVDGAFSGELRPVFEKLAARGLYAVLVDSASHIGDEVPAILSEGLADDLLLTPLRPLEILGKIKHVEHLARLDEIVTVNASLKNLIEKFEEDLKTTRAIQRSLIPEKFLPVPGLKVTHKYLSGMKSGGDYLDFFEFEDKTHVGILMSDSTGYGLSSAFMSVILKLAIKLSKDEFRSPSATIAKIFEELQLTMKPKENLSLFYGILNRKTFDLTYASLGTVKFVHQVAKSEDQAAFVDRTVDSAPLMKGVPSDVRDHKIALQPADRIVVFSDGFAETFADEGPRAVERAFGRVYGTDPMDLINDLVFRIKSRLEAEDDMPAQDCSVMVIDVEKRAMRLAK